MTTPDEDTARSQAEELSPPDESTLWLVSFGDDDDREMRSPDIALALRRGEVRADTIVWREGLPEWVPIHTIPMLARLLVTSGETRAAPAAVLAKIPLVQREERVKAAPGAAAATPLAVPNPGPPVAAVETYSRATLAGVGIPTAPSTTDDRSAETPAWKGRTRIGLPKIETATHSPHDTSPKAPTANVTGTPLPVGTPFTSATGTPLPATGTPMPVTTRMVTATGTPMPATKAAAPATGTPLPTTTKAAAPATTGGVTSAAAAPAETKPVAPATATASKGGFATLEPKRPEARAIEPKPGGKALPGTPKPAAAVPRTSVPKAAPVPTPKAQDVVTADAPKVVEKAAVPASSPKATEPTSTPNASPGSSPIAAGEPLESAAALAERTEPEPPTLPGATLGKSPEPAKAAPSPEPPHAKAAVSPEPPKAKTAASPEPPKAKAVEPARSETRKEAPKGPPPRHREPAPPGPRREAKPEAPPSRGGAAYIWEDAEAVAVDPESVRPPPPVHAIAEARAQAPGLKKKTAPKPPSPPKRTSSIPVDTDEPTIPIPMAPPVMEDIESFEEPKPVPIAPFSLPVLEEFAKTPEPQLDTTPTVPRETKPHRESKPAREPAPQVLPKPAVASVASTPPAAEKRRSLFPFVLLGAAAAAVALTFALKKQPPVEPVATAEPPHTEAPPEPTHAEVTPPPAEPAATAEVPATSAAPAATEAPAATAPAVATAPATTSKPNPTTEVAATTAPLPKEPRPPGTPKPESAPKPEATPKPTTAAKPETSKPVAAAPAQPQVSDVGGDFDRAAASSALTSAAGVASGCRKAGDPTGVAVVHVTFANSGRATRALVEGPPFAGTATGGCIADALRNTKVPPYGGDRVTVTKRVVIQ